jgi:hypothetical protein
MPRTRAESAAVRQADAGVFLERGVPDGELVSERLLSPAVKRHRALLRMLGHVKDAIASRLDELPTRRDLFRAMALAGYNSSPNRTVSGADPALKAIWARDDAEALLALGSEEEP